LAGQTKVGFGKVEVAVLVAGG